MIDEFDTSLRQKILTIFICLALIGVFARLFELQLLGKEEYGTKSRKNSIKTITRTPGRGSIFDRNKKLIVDTRPSFTLSITPNDFNEELIPEISRILEMDSIIIAEKLNKGKNFNKFLPVKIKREINFKTISYFEENHEKYLGVEIVPEPRRTYFSNARMSHFLGYIKEISDDQISKDTGYYAPGDYIGQKGLENSYEEYLRGIKGYNLIMVNSQTKKMGSYMDGKMDKDPIDGYDLILSIDNDLQLLAENLIGNRKGAVVAIDPNNGEILTMASKPDFDLNLFSGVTPVEVWDKLNNDPDIPLFNRATLGKYPPGSTFKMVLAITALEEGIIDTKWSVNCGGVFPYGDKDFKCTHVHGSVNVTRAIHQSCNIFFYNLILKVNKEKGWSFWNKYAGLLGFGKKTGVDISEVAGFIPSENYYNATYGKNWGKGFLISLAIGQGEVSVTPIQMANYCSVIANYGKYYSPHLVHSYIDKETGKENVFNSTYKTLPVSKETWDIVRYGMYLAVSAPGGTGLAAQVPGIAVGGKTGTAQNPHGKNHAWFIGFAPFDNPKIAVAVLIENGGFGGSASAPIAGALMKAYLLKSDKPMDETEIKNQVDQLNKTASSANAND